MGWPRIRQLIDEGENSRTQFKRGEMCGFNVTEPDLIQDVRNKFVRVTFRLGPYASEVSSS